MSQPDSRPPVSALQPGGKITVVEDGDLRIAVRESVEQGRTGARHCAELTALGQHREIAVIDARTHEDLTALLGVALGAFAASVRTRRRTQPK